jgi:dihydropyrimidinase
MRMTALPERRLVLRGARLMTSLESGPVDILISGPKISAIGVAGAFDGEEVWDLEGAWVMPGAIDAHTHPVHAETIKSVGTMAPTGGITTVLEHLYPAPGEAPEQAALRGLAEASKAPADFGFHVRLTPEWVTHPLDVVADSPGVVSVKVFLAHSDRKVTCNLGELYDVMNQASSLGLPVVVHAEFGDIVQRTDVPTLSSLSELDTSRPDYLEAACVASVCSIAQMTKAHAYIAHVSSMLALESIMAARGRGVTVDIETCPHYLYLGTDSGLGGLARVAPPLRPPTQRGGLRVAARDGVIDVVGSDHCGYGPGSKSQGDIGGSSNGLPGLEVLLPLLLNAAIGERWLEPRHLVRLLCAGPATAFGLQRKGYILPGFDADIVVVDPDAQTDVAFGALHDASFYSPYDGLKLKGGIQRVLRRGTLLAQRGELCSDDHGNPVSVRRKGPEGAARDAKTNGPSRVACA